MLANAFYCFVDRRLPVEMRGYRIGFDVDEERGEEAYTLEQFWSNRRLRARKIPTVCGGGILE